MKTLKDYDHIKLTGMDVDIETSLKEYGLAWVETDDEYLFYYGIDSAENECNEVEYTRFDFSTMYKDVNIKEDYCWIENWDGINSFLGSDIMDMDLKNQIHALLNYYGHDNIFGGHDWVVFTYDEIVSKD